MSATLPRKTETTVILAALALATGIKVIWAFYSAGSADAMLFCMFGQALQVESLQALYRTSEVFNHTPLTAIFVSTLYRACHGSFHLFSPILRGFSIVADIGLVLGLLHVRKITGKPPFWALALFAISPVSIMVSGFHGNLDPVMIFFLFLAAVAVLDGRPALSGALFALSCDVKVAPIALAPVFFFFWWGRGRKQAALFAGVAGFLLLLGSAVPLVQCPREYLHNVFGYGSYWGGWGITYWLRMTGHPLLQTVDFTGLSSVQSHIMTALKGIIVASLLTLAWVRRGVKSAEFFASIGAAWAITFAFAPGAGVQYMVWYAPFVLVMAPRWWVALTAGSALFMAAFYHSASKWEFPWYFAFPTEKEISFWSPFSNAAWLIFVAFLCIEGRRWYLLRPVPIGPAASGEGEQPSPAPGEVLFV